MVMEDDDSIRVVEVVEMVETAVEFIFLGVFWF